MRTFTTIGQAKKQTGLSYLGNINSSSKMIKNQKVSGNYTYAIYLAPSTESGYDVCSHSTPECRLGCLATSGRAKVEILSDISRIKNARITKTRLFIEEQEFFMNWIVAEMKHYQKLAESDGFDFSVRLNATSDIDWAKVKLNGQNLFEMFPTVQFYDYTKNFMKFENIAPNYQLTFSYSGRNEFTALKLLNEKHNVAVVFDINKKSPLPTTFMGFPVVDGDLTDFRPNDGIGVIVGLRWKHIANKENNLQIRNSRFVVKSDNPNCVF